MTSPRLAPHLKRALKRFDPTLEFEWRENHWCIVDTTSVLNYRKLDLGDGYLVDDGRRVAVSLSKVTPRYDVVMHFPPGAYLTSTNIIESLHYRRMARWARKKDFIQHVEAQLEKGERDRSRRVEDFADFSAREIQKIKRAPESVVINGGASK